MKNDRIAFIGCGNMASAMIQGILAESIYSVKNIFCYSKSGESAKRLSSLLDVQAVSDVEELSACNIWVLACKPYQLEELEADILIYSESKIILSVLAGIKIEKLRFYLPQAQCIVRTMPNTPSKIQEGFTAYSIEKKLQINEKDQIQNILSSFGESMEVAEFKMDAITAVSGSGPAYIFEIADIWIETAIKLGLSDEEARTAVLKTIRGAAMLMEDSIHKPVTLKEQVTSKGGTTEAALNSFKNNHLRKTIEAGIIAAQKKSEELSK